MNTDNEFYTNERNVQIVLYLLKAHGIRKVIASPGTTNVTLVASMQHDPFFEMYSSVDERSAAYIACGMAAESKEPVVITCTGATASRNYYPGLTEAFYRKLPVIAITATQNPARIGHHVAQVIDRQAHANDVTLYSELIQFVKNDADEWDCTIKVNKALHALKRNGGGPVHLNLETRYSPNFSVKNLPSAHIIEHIGAYDALPHLPEGRIAIFVGNHPPMSKNLCDAIDDFCSSYDAVVLCDHTSNYTGGYGIFNALIGAQDNYRSRLYDFDLLIHIGEVSGAYDNMNIIRTKQVWRVSEDGVIRDTFQKLSIVLEMPEERFFRNYGKKGNSQRDNYNALRTEYLDAYNKFPEIPFSNIWIAKTLAPILPENCVLHLGILNTLRAWNFFEIPASITKFCNTGGFGIDGIVSSMIGASLASPKKLCFCILGDLAFFYDLNSMGNRHVGNNIRIMLINNGRGIEFRNPYHLCYQFGDAADHYMAASGHYGNQSPKLIKHYASDLGYEYLKANDKDEFLVAVKRFLNPTITDKPMIFEVFTQTEDEKTALFATHQILSDSYGIAKSVAKKILPNKIKRVIKDVAKK